MEHCVEPSLSNPSVRGPCQGKTAHSRCQGRNRRRESAMTSVGCGDIPIHAVRGFFSPGACPPIVNQVSCHERLALADFVWRRRRTKADKRRFFSHMPHPAADTLASVLDCVRHVSRAAENGVLAPRSAEHAELGTSLLPFLGLIHLFTALLDAFLGVRKGHAWTEAASGSQCLGYALQRELCTVSNSVALLL